MSWKGKYCGNVADIRSRSLLCAGLPPHKDPGSFHKIPRETCLTFCLPQGQSEFEYKNPAELFGRRPILHYARLAEYIRPLWHLHPFCSWSVVSGSPACFHCIAMVHRWAVTPCHFAPTYSDRHISKSGVKISVRVSDSSLPGKPNDFRPQDASFTLLQFFVI